MIKLKVINIERYNYILENNEFKKYIKHIEFYGDKKPNIGDYIYLPNNVLEEVNLFAYGPIKGKYAKQENITEDELIKVVTKDEEYYLQRYYG